MGSAGLALRHHVAAGMAEVLECKAAWLPASQGAWERWYCGELGCSGTQEEGRGSGPSADQVFRVGVDQPFCCQHDYSCLVLVGHCQPQFHLPRGVEVWHWPLGVQWVVVWVSRLEVGL